MKHTKYDIIRQLESAVLMASNSDFDFMAEIIANVTYILAGNDIENQEKLEKMARYIKQKIKLNKFNNYLTNNNK